ncbi:MAG: alpha/beta hydrolase [bacterium]|nr:alpha/beta hydrolase [bacterium]
MRILRLTLLITFLLTTFPAQASVDTDVVPEPAGQEYRFEKPRDLVVLLHGLGRTRNSMRLPARSLEKAGYDVLNIGYPSRSESITELAAYLHDRLNVEAVREAPRVHFVTHSLGGILLRVYLLDQRPENLGRVVMLCPPNRGSEIADLLGPLIGPAGRELGKGEGSVPLTLSPVDFELGVIAGDRSINPIFSRFIPGRDDGKVSLESARVEGMNDFIVLHHSHTFIMNARDTRRQIIRFLEYGDFTR